MPKYLVTVNVRYTNTFEVEEKIEIPEHELQAQLEDDYNPHKRVNIVPEPTIRHHESTGRWELDAWDIEDVTLSDH